jgi:glycosyltransferase involved in cell wall biosynthesis
MKVLFPYPRQFGFFPDIYEYVTLLRGIGVNAFYVGKQDARQELDSPEYSFHASAPNLNTRDFVRFVSEKVAEVKPDIVHVFHFRGSGLLPLASRTCPEVNWVMDVRTIHVHNSRHTQDPFFLLKDRITWLETQVYDHILALTEKIKRRMWPSLRPVEIIPLGASWEKFNPGNTSTLRQNTRRHLAIPDGAPLFLYAGSLSPTRKPYKVIGAFARALQQSPEARLVVVGGQMGVPPEADAFVQALQHQAEELGITDSVVFTGRIPYPDVPPFYAMADIGLSFMPLGTPHQHQPPTKLIEYMMAGLLAVTNRTPANCELVTDGINGLLCGEEVEQIAEGLHRALLLLRPENKQRFKGLVAAARNSVRARDWRTIVRDRLIPLYTHLGNPSEGA